MARDSYKEMREKRAREDREDNEREAQKAQLRSITSSGGARGKPVNLHEETGSMDFANRLGDLLERAQPLIESVNATYNQYFAGVETKPPIERRKLLDSTMLQLENMPKQTLNQQWRFNNLQATYITYRNRWDKMTKGIESGRIKRAAGPKRAA
jgi:hypothetical protein